MRVLIKLALIAAFTVSGVVFAQDPKPTESPTPQQEAKPSTDVKAGDSQQSKTDSQTATIYFYRIKQFTGGGLEPSVYCDDKELARMDNGRYFGVSLEPGKHSCRMGDKQTGFELDMKPGQEYYAKVTLETGFWKGHGRLTLLQNEQGAFEIKKVKLLGADKVKDRSLVTIFEGSEKKQNQKNP
jgi:hypothetical protein